MVLSTNASLFRCEAALTVYIPGHRLDCSLMQLPPVSSLVRLSLQHRYVSYGPGRLERAGLIYEL